MANSILTINQITGEDLDHYTVLKLLHEVIGKTNELVNSTNGVYEIITYLLNEGLSEEVIEVLNKWLEDGTLEDMITDDVLGNINARLIRLEEIITNVKSYGVIGDGIIDDTQAIQNAINTVYENGLLELHFPKGLYRVTSTIETKNITLIGEGCELPFLTWEYTRANGTNDFEKYAKQCKGSVIIVPENTAFHGVVKMKDLGIFGNRRKIHSAIKCDKTLELTNVHIVGFGSYGIDMTDGCINPYINNCKIEQNIYGIVIDRQTSNDYTGETNRFYAYRTLFNRNEDYAIYGTFKGRTFHLEECTFEATGEPSDPERPKPTSYDDIKPAIELYFESTNLGMTTGDIKILNCYSEESYGFAKIHSKDVMSDVTVKGNFWRPYDQNHYSCFLGLNGYIEDVEILQNNCFTNYHYFYSRDYNLRNVVSDFDSMIDNYPSVLYAPYKGTGNGQYVNVASTKTYTDKEFASGFITGSSFDNESYADRPLVGSKGVTYFFIDTSKLNGFDMGIPGNEFAGSHCGKLLIVNNTPVGIIYSHNNSLISVIGDKTSVDIGDGSASIQRLGGMTTLRADLQQIKIVYDIDGTPIPFGK